MNVSLEKTNQVNGLIKVNVEVADYAEKVKKELKRISEKHVIPGFRKGHVPMDQLRRRFGKNVKSDVINDMVYREVLKYIKENNLNVLGQPLPVDVKEITLDDADYTFEYEIGLAPELGEIVSKEVTLPFYTISVTDEMRTEQDKALRERLGSQVPGDTVDDRALVKGAIMELNDDGTVKETEDAIQVINGIVAPFYFTDLVEADKFLGKHVNDKVQFNPFKSCNGNVTELSSMLNIDKERAANMTSNFEMAISEIIVVKPAEHDQDFFDNVFGKDKVHNEEEYNKAITDLIATSLANNSIQLFNLEAKKYFLDKYKDIELPVEFLKKWLVARNEGLNQENIDAEYEKMHDDLVWQIVKGDIVQQLNIKVNENDVLNQAKGLAYQQFMQYGMANVDDETLTNYAKQMLANEDYRSRIIDTVGDSKLFESIRNAVTLENKTVTLDEFKELAQNV